MGEKKKGMAFNEQQQQAIFSEERLVVISAGAGSGKTRVLTERVVYLCQQKLNHRLNGETSCLQAGIDQIVAMTFTEKAAREMKDRIRTALEQKRREALSLAGTTEKDVAAGFWQEQLDALGSAVITTFHGFCNRLLREHPLEAGVSPGFTVLDEVQASMMQADILDDLMADEALSRHWQPVFKYYTPNSLRTSLRDIYSALRELESSGDWNDMPDAEAVLQLQQDRKFAIQQGLLDKFYRDARGFVEAIKSLQPKKGSKPEAFIPAIIAHLEHPPDRLETAEEHYRIMKEVFPSPHPAWEASLPALYDLLKHVWGAFKAEWSLFSVSSGEERAELKRIMTIFIHMLKEFHHRYEKRKRQQAALDFADLQQKAVALLNDAGLSSSLRGRYRHFLVDEFQDTNHLQMSMLDKIKPEFLFIVGDGKQSIYRFRGADVSLMKQVSQKARREQQETDEHGCKKARFVDLVVNYRTVRPIISFVNELFSSVMGKESCPDDPPFQIEYTELQADRNGILDRCVEFHRIKVDKETPAADAAKREFRCLAERMQEIVQQGHPLVFDGRREEWRAPRWKDLAVLISSRSQLVHLERALNEQAIPYVVYGGIGFYDKQEVQDMMSLIQWLSRPWEPLYILALLRSPLFGCSAEELVSVHLAMPEGMEWHSFIYEGHFADQDGLDADVKNKLALFRSFYQRWIPFFPQASIKEALVQLFAESGLRLTLLLQPNGLQKVSNVEKLVQILEGLNTRSLEEMVRGFTRLAEQSLREGEAEVELESGDMVHIMTVHASKGLEFPIVFVPNLKRNLPAESGSFRFHPDYRLLVKYSKENEDSPYGGEKEIKSDLFDVAAREAEQEALEESKRLFYVAVTRAKDYLLLSSVVTREEQEEGTESGGEKKKGRKSAAPVSPAPPKTWLGMLEQALQENPQLKPWIWEREDYAFEPAVNRQVVHYPGPTRSEERDMPLTLSVSEIMEFVNNPRDYYYRYVLQIDPAWLEEEGPDLSGGQDSELDARLLGTLVHRCCEWIDNGLTESIAVEEALSLLEEELDPLWRDQYISELSELIRCYQAIDHEALGQIEANEWEFAAEIEGACVIGTIDKIVRTDEGYHLIDLKTNRIKDLQMLKEKYKPQLYLYKMAFGQVTGQTVKHMFLFFLRAREDGLVPVVYEPEYERKIREAIRRITELRRNKANRADYEKAAVEHV